jgi:hypothetical protein
LLLAVIMVLSFAGCTGATPEQTTAPGEEELPSIPGGSLSVPYIESDSLNPYFSETLHNSALTSLIYRSLYTLGNAPLCENLHFAPACHPPKRIHRSWALHMRIYLIFS